MVAAPGPVTARFETALSPLEDALLPTPVHLNRGEPNYEEELKRHYFWTRLMSYPFAKTFWTLVVLSFLISVGLHLSALPKIRQALREENPGGPGETSDRANPNVNFGHARG